MKLSFEFDLYATKEEIAQLSIEEQEIYWVIYYYYHLKSFIKHLPRKIGLLILPKYKSAGCFYLKGTSIPIGFVTTKGKKVYYGKQYKKLYDWGMITS